MQRVRQYIAHKQADFRNHSFIHRLEATPPLSRVVPFVPQVSFFIMAFQDLTKMIAERASDPRLRDLLRRHCEEEVGHERWFLRDVVRLAGAEPGLTTVFGPQHAPTRQATYALAAEVLGARDDVERLCLLLTMESTSEVSFGAAEAYFKRVGAADGLLFFAGRHLEAEQDHTVFEEEMAKFVATIELDPASYARVCGMVDRAYVAFNVMLDGLARVLAEGHAA